MSADPKDVVPTRADRNAWIARIAGAVIAFLAIRTALQLWAVCVADPGLPLWDEAGHGFAGLQVADAIRRVDVLGLLSAINGQTLWPFAHSLMLAPGFLVFGPDYLTARGLSCVLFAGTALLVFAAGLKLHPTRGAWVGSAAALLFIHSPQTQLWGTLAMLEVPGAFLLCAALAAHLRSLGDRASLNWMSLAGASTTLLFLCKYNYGILWLAALAGFEWRAATPALRHSLWTSLKSWIERNRRRPFALFMLAYLVFMLAILMTGGGEFILFGRPVSVRSPGNPAYGFFVLLLLWAIVPPRRRLARWRARWPELPARWRILLITVVVPLTVWFLIPYPNRIKEFFNFVTNRDSGIPLFSLERLTFYPRAIADDYTVWPWLGLAVLLIAVLPIPARSTRAASLVRWGLGVGLVSVVLHRFQEPRFLFTVMPFVWLAACHNVAMAVERASAARRWNAVREPLWIAGWIAVAAWLWSVQPTAADLRDARRAHRTPVAIGAVLDTVLARAAEAPGNTYLLGYTNTLGPSLLAWHARIRRPNIEPGSLPARLPWLAPGSDEGAIASRVVALERHADRVIVALATPESPVFYDGYRTEVWADSVTAQRLADSPSRTRAVDVTVAGAGYVVRVFDRQH